MPTTSRYRFVILAFIFASQLGMGMSYLCISPLFPKIMEQLDIGRATVSLLVSSVSLIFALGAVPAGIITARIGLRKAFGFGSVLMAAGILTPLMPNFPAVLATRVVYGFGTITRFPPISGLAMQWFKGKELTLINSVTMIGSSLGVSAGMFLVPRLAETIAWQTVLAIFGGSLLLISIAWWIFGRERKAEPAVASSNSATDSRPSVGMVLRRKETWILVLAAFGPMSLWVTLNSWLPTYYTTVFRMPAGTAGTVVSLLNLMGVPACLLGGLLPMRVGLRRPFFIVPGAVILFAAFGTFLFNSMAIIYPSVVVLGFCVWVFWPTLMTLPMELPWMTPQLMAVVIAVVMGVGNCASFAAPLIIGYLADATGNYLVGFSVWSVLSLGLLLGGLLLPETGPARKRAVALSSVETV